jgi:hypothetical protein
MSVKSLLLSGTVWLLVAPVSGADKKHQDGEGGNYVKVELKGTLGVKGSPERDWAKIKQGTSTGFRILAPGREDAFEWSGAGRQSSRWPGEKTGYKPGLVWELYLGNNPAFYERAQKLAGTTVVVTGKVTVIDNNWFSGGGGIMPPRIVVLVTSLQAADGKK